MVVSVHVATSMFQYGRPFGSAKRKPAGTRDRRLLAKTLNLKPFACSEEYTGKPILSHAHASYVSARAVTDTDTQDDYSNSRTCAARK